MLFITLILYVFLFFFFFKQKTAYEMRISDWSSDVCSSDLRMLASRDGKPIAGAVNLIGADTLYGRYWGCTEDVPFLHFELCYYQAIDYAIAHGLKHVEAGAQGAHKLARGYRPTPTWSAHYIVHPDFRRAIADY